MTNKITIDPDLGVDCQGCKQPLIIYNAGGYRSFCDKYTPRLKKCVWCRQYSAPDAEGCWWCGDDLEDDNDD